jgi:hypothetical protein
MSAEADRVALRYIREATYGETPSAALKTLRIVTESISDSIEYDQSEESVGDRQVLDLVKSGQVSSGEIAGELSFANLDDLLPGAFAGEWSTNVLANGAERISYSFEKDFQDLTDIYYAFRGMRIGSFGLDMEPRSKIRFSMGVEGLGGIRPVASIGTGSPTAATTHPVMSTLETLSIFEGKGTPTQVIGAVGFTMNIDNGLREDPQLQTADPYDIGLGECVVTGTYRHYLRDASFIDKVLGDTPSAWTITADDSDGNRYVFRFPHFKFTSLTDAGKAGRNQKVTPSLDWQAYRDPDTGLTCTVERIPA